jgi:hypothetical protein
MRFGIATFYPDDNGRMNAAVVDEVTGAILAMIVAEPGCPEADFHDAMKAFDPEYDPDDYGHGGPPNPPGYPGPCPEGMDWSEWLARNNVD